MVLTWLLSLMSIHSACWLVGKEAASRRGRRARAPVDHWQIFTQQHATVQWTDRLPCHWQSVHILHFSWLHIPRLPRLMALCPGRPGWGEVDFTEARDSEWQWHQLGHMQVCTSLQTDNHASTPPLSFLQAGCPSCRPTNCVKALKAFQLTSHVLLILLSSTWCNLVICWQHGIVVVLFGLSTKLPYIGLCLQCFDTAGCLSGRASACKNWVMRCWCGYLCGARCRLFAYGPCHPKTPSSLASFKSRLVLPSWYRLTQVVLEKRPLNSCNSSSSYPCVGLG